ncbi:MAG: hypothetical protein N2045_11000 [Fimbriimonadales bacterium]|jgi:hypothetical protein|nr:hypothetical protein [Armatimonadota bacterium]MCX7688487.1 hypothetical protein [Fimbriimonadales bacterium]GBC90111.1 hypothetical protein HRbin14_00843 [bacterium HR14]GIV14181.1 MAG: hypothetical protein KatS3mg021_2463 [Fimbriimonadales bacterium]CUU34337.1 hypothetical protein DCOP10_10738 [Armatimonadetes bacterium DC]
MLKTITLWASMLLVASNLMAQSPIIVVGAVSDHERQYAVELLRAVEIERIQQFHAFQQRAKQLGFVVEAHGNYWFVLPRSIGPDSIYGYAAALLRGLKELSSVPGTFRVDDLPAPAREACRELLLRIGELALSSFQPELQQSLQSALGQAVEQKPLALSLMEKNQLSISIHVALRPQIGIGEHSLRIPPIVLFVPRSSPLPADLQARVEQLLASQETATSPLPSHRERDSALQTLPLPAAWSQAAKELRERRGVAFAHLDLYFSKTLTPSEAAQVGQEYLRRLEHQALQAQGSFKNALRDLVEHWAAQNAFLKENLPPFGRIPFNKLSSYLQHQLMDMLRGYKGDTALLSQIQNSGWFQLSPNDIDIVISYPTRAIPLPNMEDLVIYDWRGYLLTDLMR